MSTKIARKKGRKVGPPSRWYAVRMGWRIRTTYPDGQVVESLGSWLDRDSAEYVMGIWGRSYPREKHELVKRRLKIQVKPAT